MPSLILYTGNTLHTSLLRPSTTLSQYLVNVLNKATESTDPLLTLETPTGSHLILPTPSSLNHSDTNSTINDEITAKLFLPSGISVEQAIKNVQTAIQAFKDIFYKGIQIKYFILSFGGLVFSDDEDDDDEHSQILTDEGLFKVWSAAVEAGSTSFIDGNNVSKTIIEQFGVSEFSTKRLSTLLEKINGSAKSSPTIIPTINHINAADCCALPESLINLSKKVGIKLLAHHDPENLLPQPDVDSIAVNIVNKFEQVKKCSTEPNSHQWNWILKMTHLARDRQVLTSNELLVSIGLRV
jgi:glutamate--cysteine ligase regulatory subunit